MSSTEQLAARIAQLKNEGAALVAQYVGLTSLYRAASLSGDDAKMEDYRAQIHAVVDRVLDTDAMDGMLTRQLTTAMWQFPPGG